MIYSKRHTKHAPASALQYIDKQLLVLKLAEHLRMPVAYFTDLTLEELTEVEVILEELA